MRTVILAAIAALAMGAGTAYADGEGPSDGTFNRATLTPQQQFQAGRTSPTRNSFVVEPQTHDA